MPASILVFGAAGSGTSTLGAALAARYGLPHVETDDFCWEPTTPPFQKFRSPEERQALLAATLGVSPHCVISGCISGWGDSFIPILRLAIFLWVPSEVRLARLRERELQRHGAAALAPGGALYKTHASFLEWAAAYDDTDETLRSLRRHQQWMNKLTCPIVKLEGISALNEQLQALAPYFATGIVS